MCACVDFLLRLCVLCKQPFHNSGSADIHLCTAALNDYPHTCMACGRHFAHENQVRQHKCGSENNGGGAALGGGPMFLTVPIQTDIAEIITHDGDLFQVWTKLVVSLSQLSLPSISIRLQCLLMIGPTIHVLLFTLASLFVLKLIASHMRNCIT